MQILTKRVIIVENQKRFEVFRPSVHGKKKIGSTNNLIRAITIGDMYGCREPGCPCCKYEIYDNKLHTSDIEVMIKNVLRIK